MKLCEIVLRDAQRIIDLQKENKKLNNRIALQILRAERSLTLYNDAVHRGMKTEQDLRKAQDRINELEDKILELSTYLVKKEEQVELGSRVVRLPKKFNIPPFFTDTEKAEARGVNRGIDECAEAIKAAGGSVIDE